MLDHVSIQCADLPRAAAFYDAVLAPVGGGRVLTFGEVVGYGVGQKPSFWLGPLSSGRTRTAKSTSPSPLAIGRPCGPFFDAAVAQGASVLHEPRVWPEYHLNYYGAFVRDPDGNNVEAVCHVPE